MIYQTPSVVKFSLEGPKGFDCDLYFDVGGNDLVICNPRGSGLQITSLPRYNQSFTATQFQERRLTPGTWRLGSSDGAIVDLRVLPAVLPYIGIFPEATARNGNDRKRSWSSLAESVSSISDSAQLNEHERVSGTLLSLHPKQTLIMPRTRGSASYAISKGRNIYSHALSEVFLGRHSRLDAPAVVVKVVKTTVMDDENAASRVRSESWLREYKAHYDLEHVSDS